ncbi:hypothetical protein G8759_34820 [Spirosoma aureum]|uniref:DUF3052 domain-containing protein n=1 Tax=Spirosoma aureum TaxID=2692134 RepID=A0A6G9AYM9_9BACT|nr:hypothetical protein [Spirosoma aureum]QIP17449.1 hypothetical protein G8759_34820 [Spirosoma aureum]
MHPTFAKLNYKSQPEITVINAPEEFAAVVDTMRPFGAIITNPEEIREGGFLIAFVKTQQEVDQISELVAQKIQGDGLLWFAYPKGSSKKYTCDFNRDTGWTTLGKLGFESVRMIAIDNDWSALRFRRVEYIKKMTRQPSRAMTDAGKSKTSDE